LSRYRSSNAPTDTDRQIQALLDRASRSVGEAIRLASSAPVAAGRGKRRVSGDLERAMAALQTVRYIGASPTGRDEMSEVELNRLHRERLSNERAERRAAVKEQIDVG